MRRSFRFGAVGLGAVLVFNSLPARANHVLQPACDFIRQSIIAANTAAANAGTTFGPAETLVAQALANVGVAVNQFVFPTTTYIIAQEDNVGLGPARSGFESSLAVLVSALNLYNARLSELVQLRAMRDLNQQVAVFLDGVRARLDARYACPPVVPPPTTTTSSTTTTSTTTTSTTTTSTTTTTTTLP